MESELCKQSSCNARIALTSTQTVEKRTERSVSYYDAHCQFEPTQTIITYFEKGVDTETVITITEAHTARIVRRGGIETEFLIVMGESHPTTYTTLFGTLQFSIRGMEVTATRTPNDRHFFLKYAIEVEGEISSVNTIALQIDLQ